MSKTVTWYYRLAIAFSVLSWLFLVIGDHMITCPHVGKATGKLIFPPLVARILILYQPSAFPSCPRLKVLFWRYFGSAQCSMGLPIYPVSI